MTTKMSRLDPDPEVTIYAPVIYTRPCIMFWRRRYTLCGEVGGGWALEFPSFLGPVKWHRADRRVPFGAPTSPSNVYPRLQNIMHRGV